jgi:RNA polymerase sigma-70 factor (ECF subfamily)
LSALQALKKAKQFGMKMFEQAAKPWRQARDAQAAIPGKNQDWAAFGLLLQRYRADVIHFLYRMVQDVTVAEELALEVFLRSGPAMQSATRLFRIATDLALGELRNAKSPSMTGQTAEESMDLFGVGGAVASMPGKQRAAVVMHKYHQMDYEQIARVLNCSESVAKSLLSSAYETLRQRLAPYAVTQK